MLESVGRAIMQNVESRCKDTVSASEKGGWKWMLYSGMDARRGMQILAVSVIAMVERLLECDADRLRVRC